jgi:hypothetical protein
LEEGLVRSSWGDGAAGAEVRDEVGGISTECVRFQIIIIIIIIT